MYRDIRLHHRLGSSVASCCLAAIRSAKLGRGLCVTDMETVGILEASLDFVRCGSAIAGVSTPSCKPAHATSVRSKFLLTSIRRFIVDSADKEALPVAKEELHVLIEKPAMEGIPLLILGNKSDLPNHATVDELIEALNLKVVTHREVSCYGISAKEETNLDAVLHWLIARANK